MDYTYNENELQHYGVLGMKWGKRKAQADISKYQNKANKHSSKIATSKTRLGKNYHNRMAFNNEYLSNKAKAHANSKSIIDRLSNESYTGRQNLINRQKASANYYKRKAEYSKTKLGKSKNEARAFNNASYAKSNEKIRDAKGIKNKGKAYIEGIFKTPVKTWSGRQISSGQKMVEQMFGGYEATYEDIQTYKKRKK